MFLIFLKTYFADASGPSTVITAALDANDITSRAVLTRGDNAGDHSCFGGAEAALSFGDQSNFGSRFGGHRNSNTCGTSSSSAFIYTENTEESNRAIADVSGNVSPTGGDDGTVVTHGINRPEGTSRVPIVTDSVDDDSTLFGGRHSTTIRIGACNDCDVEITRVLDTV